VACWGGCGGCRRWRTLLRLTGWVETLPQRLALQ